MTSGGTPRWRLVRAGTDAVPAWIRRFFATRRRRSWRGRRWVLAGLVAALVALAGWVAAGTSLLGVDHVRVTGTEILTPAEVRAAAAVPERHPLLRVPADQVADRVAALAPVAQVEVSRDWPDAVVVEVVERTAVAAVPVGDQDPGEGTGQPRFVLVDAEGVAFHTVAQVPLEVPVVVLADPGRDNPETRAALTVLAALTPTLRAELETLTVVGPGRIELSLFSGHTVRWGDEADSEQKARVATALLAQQTPDPPDLSDVEVIDVSAPEVVSLR